MKFMGESDTSRCLNEKPNPCSCLAKLWYCLSSWAYILLEKLPMWLKSWVLSLPRGISASRALQPQQDSPASPSTVSLGCQAQVQHVCSEAQFV